MPLMMTQRSAMAGSSAIGERFLTPSNGDVLVDLVGHHGDLWVLLEHRDQCQPFCAAVDGTGRVGRRVDDQPAGLVGNRRLKQIRRQLEARLRATSDDFRLTTVKGNNVRIAHPVGGGNDHLVARIECGREDVEDQLFGTVGDHDLTGGNGDVVIPLQLVGNRLPQGRSALRARIMGIAGAHRLIRGRDDVVGRVEVRFAQAKVQNLDTLSPQLIHFLFGSNAC